MSANPAASSFARVILCSAYRACISTQASFLTIALLSIPGQQANTCMPSSETNVSRSKESNPASSSSEQKQQTISQLFATSKNTSARPDAADLRNLSPRKRVKHTHTTSSEVTLCRGLGDMYNSFPPASPTRKNGSMGTKAEVIDLTGSPGPAPSKPAQSRRTINGATRPSSNRPSGGPKKLIVKNLRTTPKTNPDVYYNRVSDQLDIALSAIFNGAELPCSLEELYKGVESLCKEGRAPALYQRLCEKCKHTVTVQVSEPLVQYASTATSVDLLDAVVKAWSTWKTQLVSHLTQTR